MSDDLDRWLIGKVFEAELTQHYPTLAAMARDTEISLATLERVKSGHPKVTEQTYARVGRWLNLPRGFLLAVGWHDWTAVRGSGAPPDLIRLAEGLASTDREEPHRKVKFSDYGT